MYLDTYIQWKLLRMKQNECISDTFKSNTFFFNFNTFIYIFHARWNIKFNGLIVLSQTSALKAVILTALSNANDDRLLSKITFQPLSNSYQTVTLVENMQHIHLHEIWNWMFYPVADKTLTTCNTLTTSGLKLTYWHFNIHISCSKLTSEAWFQ